jgi:hypothetical protein
MVVPMTVSFLAVWVLSFNEPKSSTFNMSPSLV